MNYYLRIGQGMEIRIGIKQLHGRKRFINVNISKNLILFESCNSMYKRILILNLLTHRSHYVYETSSFEKDQLIAYMSVSMKFFQKWLTPLITGMFKFLTGVSIDNSTDK